MLVGVDIGQRERDGARRGAGAGVHVGGVERARREPRDDELDAQRAGVLLEGSASPWPSARCRATRRTTTLFDVLALARMTVVALDAWLV